MLELKRISCREIFKDFLTVVGLASKFSLSEAIGIVIGFLCGIVVLLSRAYFENTFIHFTEITILLPLIFIRLESIFIMPILEEIIYRGFFINRIMSIFGRKKVWGSLTAIILSSFVFGWIHWELPIYKLFLGIILATVYLWGGKKNIVKCTIAHISYNFLVISLYLS
jgi:membrane protease YdiL (CAAX protease family)